MKALSTDPKAVAMRARRAAQVARRRAEGKCLECESPKAEGGHLCAPHLQRKHETMWIYRRTEKGRKKERRHKRRVYKRAKRAHRCVDCRKRLPDLRKGVRCRSCAVKRQAWTENYTLRKQGLLPPVERTTLDIEPIPTATPVADYHDGILPLASAVLRFVELCNGVTARDVAEEFGLEGRDRNGLDVALSRFARTGKVRVEQESDGRRYFPLRERRRAA